MTDPTPDDARDAVPESPADATPASVPPAPGEPGQDAPTEQLPVQPAALSAEKPETPDAPTVQLPVQPAVPPAAPPAAPPRPSPGPRHAAPATDERRGHPRRWFLAGAGAAVLAAAGGTGAALLRDRATTEPNSAPAALLAAIAAERDLLADLTATTGGTPEVRRVLTAVAANHTRHLTALQELATAFDDAAGSSAPAASGSTPAAGTPRTRAQLRAAEQRASRQAASRAASLDGRTATLLASIAACEATHAELLT